MPLHVPSYGAHEEKNVASVDASRVQPGHRQLASAWARTQSASCPSLEPAWASGLGASSQLWAQLPF